jgi:tripartite-type tricarboxylate transporter receptor subunit TctC
MGSITMKTIAMFSRLAFGLLSLCVGLALPAQAQPYPSKPIRVIFPFSGGLAGDSVSRMIAQGISESVRQAVVVEPRPGANGILGSDIVAKAAPDGYTTIIFSTTNTNTINASLHSKLPYDPIKDFTPITKLGSTPYLLVAGNQLPANSIKEFVALAKASPTKYSIGYTTSTPQLASELLKIAAGINLLLVPYKTSGAAYVDLASGQLDVMMESMASARIQVQAGRLKALAITSLTRSPLMPETPTVAESGYPGFEADTLLAAFAPAGMPKEIVAKLNAEIVRVLRNPELKDKIGQLGIDVVNSTPEQLADVVATDLEKWAKVIRTANIPKTN